MEVQLAALTDTYATIVGDGFELELPVGGSFGKSTFHAYDAANGVALVDDELRNVGDTWEVPVYPPMRRSPDAFAIISGIRS